MKNISKLGWFTLGATVALVVTTYTIIAMVLARQKELAKPKETPKEIPKEIPEKEVPASPPVLDTSQFASISWAGAPDTIAVWQANKTSAVVHSRSSCSNMSTPIELTKAEAAEKGIRPCNNCWGDTDA